MGNKKCYKKPEKPEVCHEEVKKEKCKSKDNVKDKCKDNEKDKSRDKSRDKSKDKSKDKCKDNLKDKCKDTCKVSHKDKKNNLDQVHKYAKGAQGAHEKFEEELADALALAQGALCELKDAAESIGDQSKFGNKIKCWMDDNKGDCCCNQKYDDCECKKIAKKLSCLIDELNEELEEALKALCVAIHEIEEIEKLDGKFHNVVKKYIDCIHEEDCKSSSSSECCESSSSSECCESSSSSECCESSSSSEDCEPKDCRCIFKYGSWYKLK